MADLSNLKIANTFSRLLQADPDTTQLQDGLGDNPPTITFNGTTIKYVDGNQQNNYVLTSDANGVASWAAAGGSDTNVYWSASTGGISNSGLTGNVGIGTSTPNKPLTVVGDISGTTNLYVSGDTHTTNLILDPGGYIMPATSNNTIKIRAQDYDGEMLSIGPDLFHIKMDELGALTMTPTATTFNESYGDVIFLVQMSGGTTPIHVIKGSTAIGHSGGTSIGGTTQRWPTSTGYDDSEPNKTLQVNGITTIHSGGTGNSWSADTTALTVVGDISGTTDLYLGDSVHTASTITAQEQLIIRGRGVDNDFMTLKQDQIDFNLDGSQAATFIAPTHSSAFAGFSFNSSNVDMDFKVSGEDNFAILNIDGATGINKVRLRDHLVIGSNEAISHANSTLWGLSVTGSSLFYGGVGVATSHAIHASGVISASTEILAGDGDGFISAATINAPSISATTLYGTIDGGTF